MSFKMKNKRQSIQAQVQQTNPTTDSRIKLEPTNYGWRVQLPLIGDRVTVYEAQRCKIDVPGDIRLLRVVASGSTHLGEGKYDVTIGVYRKIGARFDLQYGIERPVPIRLQLNGTNPQKSFPELRNFNKDDLETKAFELLSQVS